MADNVDREREAELRKDRQPIDDHMACKACGLESCFWDLEPCPENTHGSHGFEEVDCGD